MEIAERILHEYNQAASSRGTLESHWQEIAERVLPSYSGSFNINNLRTEGDKRTEKMLDVTAANAATRFASAMDSMLTPRNALWHALRSIYPDVNKDRDSLLWFDAVRDILFRYRYSPRANFASQNHANYLALGVFGTACMFIDELPEGGLRYKSIPLGEIYFFENHQGIIDHAIRQFKMSVRQAHQRWGDKLPDEIKGKLERSPNEMVDFLHCVKPREDYDQDRIDSKGKPFASYYLCKEKSKVLEEGGYTTFPYAISRYTVAPGEVYGRSPGMSVLPSIKVLNEQKATILKQGHRALDPVLLAHDDGVLDSFSMKPGALNYGGVNADGRLLVQALPTGSLAVGRDMMEDERASINDAFLITLFQILVDSPAMTATEVMERAREKGALLAPTIGQQQSEYLGPMIDREIDLLSSQGRLPPMPQLLREMKAEYQVQYDSPMSRAQRSEEGAGALRTMQWASEIANSTQDAAILDWFNYDEMMPEIADINAMPARWINDKNVVAQKRKQRAEQQEAQMAIQAAPALASMVGKTGAA